MNKFMTLVIAILLISCNHETQTKNSEKIFSYLSASKKDLTDIQAVFVIPNGGCGGCISNFENKLYDNQEALNKILIVYTEIKDKKKLHLLLPENYFNHNNIVFDYDNVLKEKQFLSFYPYCMVLNKGELQRDFFMDGTSEENEKYLNDLFVAK